MLSDNSPEQIEKANSLIVLPDEEGPGDDVINTIEFVGGGGIIDVKIFEDLTNDQIQEVIKLLLEYTDVYWEIPGRATVIEHKIVHTADTAVRVKPDPILWYFRNQFNEEIQALIRLGIIEDQIVNIVRSRSWLRNVTKLSDCALTTGGLML